MMATTGAMSVGQPDPAVLGAISQVSGEGREAAAAAIPGARLEIIEGLGHDLPEPLWPRLAELIAQETKAA